MKYYKVKPENDQRKVGDITRKRAITTLVANELYTEKEMDNKGLIIYPGYFDVVNVSSKRTYFFFGARFETTLL